MVYPIKINKRALNDIQKALNHYDKIDTSIGDKFQKNLDKTIVAITSNPFFQIRYSDVRCLLFTKFPYMIHFQVNEKKNIVIIRAVTNTSKNPKTNWIK
jgi:toxin ParE1/3/4